MPTVSHDTPLDLLRHQPRLAVALLGAADIAVPHQVTAMNVSPDLSIVYPEPKDRRGDSVTLVEGPDGFSFVVVTEVQHRRDDTKVFRWPFYLARACDLNDSPPGVLVIVCRTPTMARWCREAIRTSHPDYNLIPVVLDATNTPDPYTSGMENILVELAVLAAHTGSWNLERRAVRNEILAVIARADLETDQLRTYTHMILHAAGVRARKDLERLMTTEYKADFWDVLEAEAAAKANAAQLGAAGECQVNLTVALGMS